MVLSKDNTISVRLIWPFMRVLGVDPLAMTVLAQQGVSVREFANPDTRVAHVTVQNLLRLAVAYKRDPLLGLKAAENFGPADLDVLEYAGRSCATLREGARCATRYVRLLNSAADTSLEERGDVAIWHFRVADGVQQAPAANDFELAVFTNLAQRYTGSDKPALEVHFAHEHASSDSEYARVFGCPIKLGMPHNAIVFPRDYLDAAMVHADAGLHAAFETHVEELLERLRKNEGVAGRTRALLLANLSSGQTSMAQVAKALAMSVPTLRRRLEEEGTTHSDILEDIRKELALRYLDDEKLAISEVAFLLGFSHVAAFYKAFRRWENGSTPADYRKRRRAN